MRLWILRLFDPAEHDLAGFIVTAPREVLARRVAAKAGGEIWADYDRTVCRVLADDSRIATPGVILGTYVSYPRPLIHVHNDDKNLMIIR